jgi:dinuclear metal center YbgI/SA1388 family protein
LYISMLLKELVAYLESLYPRALQESYDNSGLVTGDLEQEVTAVLISLDITETVIDEAILNGCQLVLSHHPPVFKAVKKITGNNSTERILIKAIRNGLAMYSAHTNMDNAQEGLNSLLCRHLDIQNPQVLSPMKGHLRKLVTYVPLALVEEVRNALFTSGAGTIGAYDSCSFNTEGVGTYRAGLHTHPFAGKKGVLHKEPEIRIETVFPVHLQDAVIQALVNAHPYEEVAYDIYPVENDFPLAGAGLIGSLKIELTEEALLGKIKKELGCSMIRHSGYTFRPVRTVAVCGGSGSFLITEAIRRGADVFITADLKYHQFSEAENRILLVDAGHFETEQFAKELFYDVLIKKFPNFAVRFSETETNPVKYY